MAPEKVDWGFAKPEKSLAKQLFVPITKPKQQLNNSKTKTEPTLQPEVYYYQQLPVIQYYYEPRRVIYGTKSICLPQR